MRSLAASAILAILVASPVLADSDKHRRQGREYSYGALVSQCNHRANGIGLRGHERHDFVDWCTDRGRAYAWRDWERRDWDRIRYVRDRFRDRYGNDWRDRDDWEDRDGRRLAWLLQNDPDFRYARYEGDWQYAALQDFLRWTVFD
jgi:hypothetical protein